MATKADFLALIPAEGTTPKSVVMDKLASLPHCTVRRARALLDECLSDEDVYEWKVDTPGRRPVLHLSFIAQPVEPPRCLIDEVENYLSDKYDFRLNEITNDLEYKLKLEDTWQDCNENDVYCELQRALLPFKLQDLTALLGSSWVPTYNPINTYFEELEPYSPAEGDLIGYLTNHVELKDDEQREQFTTAFRKHIMRVVRCAREEYYFNKHCLVFVDKQQSTGKTTFLNYLCPDPLKEYCIENMDDRKTDGEFSITENLLINLDELASLWKRELNTLKSMFSKTHVKCRRPYAKRPVRIPRISSFVGSTNEPSFLQDLTGSVRWICFETGQINFAYSQKVDMDRIYAQAIWHIENGDYNGGDMTPDEVMENEARNEPYQTASLEEELIGRYLEPGTAADHIELDGSIGGMLKITDIIAEVNRLERKDRGDAVKLDALRASRGMGSALQAMGFKNRHKVSGKTKYGYFVRYTAHGDFVDMKADD